MKVVNDNELERINGGISAWAIAGIGVLATFISGIIDGIARPVKCRS